jgi:hypothetical protein
MNTLDLNVLQLVVNGGVLVMCTVVLMQVWGLLRGRRDFSRSQFKVLIATMVFSLLLVVLSAGVELTKFLFDAAAARKAKQGEFAKQVRDVLSAVVFEPQSASGNSSGDWKYETRAPSGLSSTVVTSSVFQDFSDKWLVQRLWADPRDENSWIHAYRRGSSSQPRLTVDFSRALWGCDVTLKPRNNQAVNTRTYKSMIVWLQGGSLDAGEWCKEKVAFHLRIVDGRANHWTWGRSDVKSDGTRHTVFGAIDAKAQRMVIQGTQPNGFVFDLTSLKNWAPFEADGSFAPFQDSEKAITCIQNVVIEPGLENKDGDVVALATDDPGGNERSVKPSPKKPTGQSGTLPSRFDVLGVEFSAKKARNLTLGNGPSFWSVSSR